MITDNIEGLFALSSISSQDCLQWNVESLTQTWFIHNLSEYLFAEAHQFDHSSSCHRKILLDYKGSLAK